MTRNEKLRRYGSPPYDGLFGDSNLVSVLEQVIADPYVEYHPIDLARLTKETPPTVRKSLKILTSLGLLIKDKTDIRHPVYMVNTDSKRYLALTFLAYAILDDKLGTDTMDRAIADYCDSVLREKYATRESTFAYSPNQYWIDADEIKKYIAQSEQVISPYKSTSPQKEMYGVVLADTGKFAFKQPELESAVA